MITGNGPIEVDDKGVVNLLNELKARMSDLTPVMGAIGQRIQSSVQQNFEVGGRWSGIVKSFLGGSAKWKELKPATKKRKAKAGKEKTLIMSGILKNSISSTVTPDSVTVGTNVPYGAIHQFGGDIYVGARTVKTRHRTDAKGNLLRQDGFKNLVKFASAKHKRVKERFYSAEAHTIHIPARPFLVIQEEDFAQNNLTILSYLVKGL